MVERVCYVVGGWSMLAVGVVCWRCVWFAGDGCGMVVVSVMLLVGGVCWQWVWWYGCCRCGMLEVGVFRTVFGCGAVWWRLACMPVDSR